MVFVLDKHKRPLMPCKEKSARKLLREGKAVIHKLFPFTIRLKHTTVEECNLQPLRLKIDPGAKVTGLAILREYNDRAEVIWLGEIHHKANIKDKLKERRDRRRSRRNRKTRYRKCRFNRKKPEGWLPPSLMARVNQTINAVQKIMQYVPITAISVEHAKFDTQKMQNPEISGIEYQQGTLQGYEVREYLLEKWGRKCAYCGATNVKLQVEHVFPKSLGGTDRVSNLTMACERCNEEKDNLRPEEWLEKLKKSKRPIDKIRAKNFEEVMKQLKEPLREAAYMNAVRWKLVEELKKLGLPVELGTGARTKMQRIQHKLPKTHYYDACCVGASTPENLEITTEYVQIWTAIGRGTRQMVQTDKYGFPAAKPRSRTKRQYGIATGDMVRAETKQGTVIGRVTVRSNGSCYIQKDGKRINFTYKKAKLLQYGDGWNYSQVKAEPYPVQE